jgi:hypothetical protein
MSSSAPREVIWFAIGLKSPEGSHCGVVYESDGQKYLHFAWDSDLRREAISLDKQLRLVATDLTETNKNSDRRRHLLSQQRSEHSL